MTDRQRNPHHKLRICNEITPLKRLGFSVAEYMVINRQDGDRPHCGQRACPRAAGAIAGTVYPCCRHSSVRDREARADISATRKANWQLMKSKLSAGKGSAAASARTQATSGDLGQACLSMPNDRSPPTMVA